MSSQRTQLVGGIVLGSIGMGLAIYGATRSRSPQQNDDMPGGQPAHPVVPAEPLPSAAQTEAFDRDLVSILDRSLPGSAASYDLLRYWLQRDSGAVAETSRRYQGAYSQWLAEQARLGRIAADRAAAARDILNGLNISGQLTSAGAQLVGAGVNAVAGIPGVGAVIKGVYDIVQQFVEAAAAAAKEGKGLFDPGVVSGGEPIFSGFKDGNFYFWDIPVWSFTAPMWVTEFKLAGGGAAPPAMFAAFLTLATRRPFGLPVARVRIESSGGYFYQFNLKGDGDVSDAAIQRREVRGFEVWNPDDITPLGPRGFDPAHPWAWKRPGARSSVFDPVYSAIGGL